MPMPELPTLQQIIEAFPTWLDGAVAFDPRLGYLLLALAMLLENLIPPIPSELIQPLGGFLVQQGRLELVPVILAGVVGTVLGCWFWYGLGRWIGEERLLALLRRHERWLGIGEGEVETGRRWFQRHGLGLVFWGRMVPGIRTLISVPAGLEGMAQLPFLLATLAGSLLWVSLLTFLGRALGAGYHQAVAITGPLGTGARILLGLAGALALAALVRRALLRRRAEA